MLSKLRDLVNPLKTGAIPVLLIVSLALNVVLAWELRRARAAGEEVHALAVGDRAPEFRAREISGDASGGTIEQIRYGAAPKGTLIYYFSPHCGWCQKNAANFRTLAAAIAPDYQVVSYTGEVDGLQKYLRAARHPARVFTDDDVDIRRLLKLTGTPETLLVSRSGRVMKNWEGAYSGGMQREIEAYFGVQLPGLAKWQTAADFQRAGF